MQEKISTQKQALYRCYKNDPSSPSEDMYSSSLFDLIGKKEPDQTKSLGYVLAHSSHVRYFLLEKIIGAKRAKNLMACNCIVDCEFLLENDRNTNERADIVIRFPEHNEIVIIEAKSLNAKTKADYAINQAMGYARKMNFDKCTIVSLTNSKMYGIGNHKDDIYETIALQWSDIIDIFDNVVRKNRDNVVSLEKDFLNYILKIKGLMKYYDIEVLSIPAGGSIDGVEKAGIYECPSEDAPYKSRGEHKPLFIAFRGEKGLVRKLYKVAELISIPIAGPDYTIAKESLDLNLVEKIEKYKEVVRYDTENKDERPKWVFFLDEEKSITLPHPVIYKKNNTFVETKRPLRDYFDENKRDGDYIVFS